MSLFNTTDNNAIIERIHKLTPESKPLWGKMTVAQMLAHAQQPLKVAFGELQLKQSVIGFLFGSYYRKKYTGKDTYSKNSPTDSHFIIRDNKNFEEEKNKLIPLVQRFAKEGASAITKQKHPFFGKLTTEDWDILQSKHLDHHLRQFGV